MKHRDATELLVEFAEGSLEDVTWNEMNDHVAACKDCQDWLHTFTLLSHVPEGSEHHSHPDSLDLAKCSTRPDEECEPDHRGLRSHLSSCRTCRQDLETVRRAVVHARPGAETHATSPFTPARSTTWWWTAAAATGIVGFALGAIFGTGIAPGIPNASTSHDRGAGAAVGVAPGAPPASRASISGERLIRSEDQITIVNTSILPGASVTIQARRGVALGNGFQVGSGTQVEVGAPGYNDSEVELRRKGERNQEG